MILFEWEEAKAESNRRKHGVRFEVARLVFAVPYALTEQDRVKGGERRWQTIGLVGGIAILLVAHTVSEEGQDEVLRIMSARRANRRERTRYEENREKNIS
jgi:uncharacterized DUF497 family protein